MGRAYSFRGRERAERGVGPVIFAQEPNEVVLEFACREGLNPHGHRKTATCGWPRLIRWLGFRPSMPGSPPVIGQSPETDRIIYAFGHAHLGLTLAGLAGMLLSDLISNRKRLLDVTALRPRRRL